MRVPHYLCPCLARVPTSSARVSPVPAISSTTPLPNLSAEGLFKPGWVAPVFCNFAILFNRFGHHVFNKSLTQIHSRFSFPPWHLRGPHSNRIHVFFLRYSFVYNSPCADTPEKSFVFACFSVDGYDRFHWESASNLCPHVIIGLCPVSSHRAPHDRANNNDLFWSCRASPDDPVLL